MWLFVMFLAVPIVEIALFIQVGGWIGMWSTLGVVVLTAIAGTWLVRAQGRLAIGQLQRSFSELNDPTEPLAHGAMILIAGALLLTPGFFTDAVGFALLFPPVRRAAFNYVQARVTVQSFSMGSQEPARRGGHTIDGEFSEVSPDPAKAPGHPLETPQDPGRGQTPPSEWTKH